MSSDVHGRKRERTTADIIKARREKDASKITEYNNLVQECRERVAAGQLDNHTLKLTTQILHSNPDYYTMWNTRRNVLKGGILLPLTTETATISDESSATPQDTSDDSPAKVNQKVYLQELDLFMQLIRINPKSYWLWNHRCWCLESMPQPSWTGELKLVDKMLTMDERNFHGWNYRRYVVGHLRRAAAGNDEAATIVQQEYNFTTQKITQSFSNYSAWHQRSKLLPEIVMHMSEDEKNEVARNELAMVGDAIFTDPDDQSAWLYYWWLMGKAPFLVTVAGAFRSTNSSIIVGFNGVVGFSAFPKVIATTNMTPIAGQWYAITIPSSSTPLYGTKHSSSSVWLFVSDQQQQSDEKWAVRIQSNDVYPISSAMSVEPDHIWTEPVKETDALENVTEMVTHTIRQGRKPQLLHRYKDPINEGSNVLWYSLDPAHLLTEAIGLLRELLDLEPDSKWALHTLVHFLQQRKLRSGDNEDDEAIQILERLSQLDYYRKEHYLEMKQQVEFTRRLDTLWKDQDAQTLLLHLLHLGQ